MAQKGWEYILDNCTGCHGCTIACKAGRFRDPEQSKMLRRFAIGVPKPVTAEYFVPTACNHCFEPSCIAACPKGALVKEDNGIVTQRLDRCVGCRRCEWACPYGAIEYDDDVGKVTKCDMCYDRQVDGLTDEDKTPWCALTCAAFVLNVIEDFEEADSGDGAPPSFADEAFTKPAIRFIGTDTFA